MKQHAHTSQGDGGLLGDLSVGTLTLGAGKKITTPSIETDAISEKTALNGVAVNHDVTIAAGKTVSTPSLNTDAISEKTGASGIAVNHDVTLAAGKKVSTPSLEVGGANISTGLYVSGAGVTLTHSHDAVQSTANTSYTLIKKITITRLLGAGVKNAILTIKFEMKHFAGGAWGVIYKNGLIYGTVRSNSSTEYILYSEDLSFAEGDTIEIWGHGVSGNSCYIQNLRVYISTATPTLEQAIDNGDTDTDPFTGTNTV